MGSSNASGLLVALLMIFSLLLFGAALWYYMFHRRSCTLLGDLSNEKNDVSNGDYEMVEVDSMDEEDSQFTIEMSGEMGTDDLDDLFLTELDMQNPSLDFVDSMKDEINPFHNQDTSIDSGHRISISTPGSAERKIIQSEAMSQFVKNINSNNNTPQP